MKNRIIGALMLFLIVSPAVLLAQKDLSLNQAVVGRWGELATERLSNLSWIPGTNSYTYSEKVGDDFLLVMVNAATFDKNEIVSTPELSAQLPTDKALTRLPNFHWLTKTSAYFVYSNTVYHFEMVTKEVIKLYDMPKDGANWSFRPNSADVAFTRENNLFVIANGTEYQVTSHTDPNIIAGQTVSRVEFGIETGIVWSKSGKSLAFYEKDETQVTNYPLLDYSVRPAKLSNTKYPMAGMPSEEVQVGIYNLASNKTVYLQTENAPESYLTALSWNTNDKSVFVAHLNRGQDSLQLKQYNPKNGALVGEIFTETNEKYVHPTHSLNFIGKNEFLWQSEKNGLNQFYLYNIGGNVNWHINTGDILVRSFVSYNKDSKTLLFLGNHKDKIDQHLFSVNIQDGGNSAVKQLTSGEVYHSRIKMNEDRSFGIVSSSSLTTPAAYDLVEIGNGSISNLLTADNPLKDYKIGETQLSTFATEDDSTIIHTRTILPHDFDASKKYPVLVYVYNGPGVQLLHTTWMGSASWWMYHFANKGYIVYSVDGRGSANRGIEFEQSTFRNLGELEMKDQLEGLAHLKSLPYVDTARIGVHGWSYGGFMTTNLLTTYPGTFKVGVAGGPVMDWSYYEVMYTERYMDTPAENPEGYEKSSNISQAKNLRDPLLIIHGTSDPTVVKQHSDLFLKECISNGVQVDYFEYPGHGHNVRGMDRIHLMQKVLDYIEIHL